MALVDYGSSDEDSESENGTAEEVKQENDKKPTAEVKTENLKNDDIPDTTLFSALPKPKAALSFLSHDNKLGNLLLTSKTKLPKSDKEVIKISVPSMSDFKDDDEPVSKKLKPSVKGTGLFSVLPPPKNMKVKEPNRTLIPDSVSKSNKVTVKNDKIPQKFLLKPASVSKKSEVGDEIDDDDDAAIGSSFFGSSLSESNSNTSIKTIDEEQIKPQASFSGSIEPLPAHIEQNVEGVTCPLPLEQQSTEIISSTTQEHNNFIGPCISQVNVIPVDNNPLELDEKALQILCGNKKKRQQMAMNIVDLSGEEVMPDSKEWLLKQLSEEKKVRSHSHKKGTGPSSQQRRKHQITYLAFQAKAQELELQNQWANNRMSRRQTQSKYGF